MLGDVEETVYLVDDEVEGEEVRTVSKKSEMLFVRGKALCKFKSDLLLTPLIGDSVVLISPFSQS